MKEIDEKLYGCVAVFYMLLFFPIYGLFMGGAFLVVLFNIFDALFVKYHTKLVEKTCIILLVGSDKIKEMKRCLKTTLKNY